MAIFEIKQFKKFLFWTIIIAIFSIIGFLGYVIIGNELKFYTKKQIKRKHKCLKSYLKTSNIEYNFNQSTNYNNISSFIKKNYNCEVWNKNIIKTYYFGNDFLSDLLVDISLAKDSIHLEFFIFSDDATGQQIATTLINKAKQGVNIKIIYDAFGSRKTKDIFWQRLKENNIDVEAFLPPISKFPFLNFRINYRNHRKIAIIDGKIAYTGGINLRNDHMGLDKKLKPWRDTQIKIQGFGVYSLQDIFLNDWQFCTNKRLTKYQIKKYFPTINSTGNLDLQVISDGPDTDCNKIFHSYLKIIDNAKKYIFIQTPYFLINKQMETALLNAIKRNVKVCIVIPRKPDKRLVYSASILNISNMLKNNASVYLYKGFIHSKILSTESVISIGSCNFDYRSFFLNFESTCLCYNKSFITKNKSKIADDINNSILLTKKMYRKLKTNNIFFILLFKCISKLL